MKEFKGKVAVITGAASGIGRGIAERCVQEGMKVVLADIEEIALNQTEKDLRTSNGSIMAIRTDVSQARDIEFLAQKTIDSFGAVHLLFNNAGVAAGFSAWESTLADWEWVIGVKLWGVIHGCRTFIPIMLRQDTECHIVNTSSIAGLLSYHPSASYQVVMHGVVALSEHLYHSLTQRKAKVKVSVLCPYWVKTRILESERNRPPELQNPQGPEDQGASTELQAAQAALQQEGISPQQAADFVFDAIRENKFYIFTDTKFMAHMQIRMNDILKGGNPTALPPL